MDDPSAPSNIVINGTEYTPDEAQELIETGRKTRDYESRYNTKLDSVWPEYTKLSQERSSWSQKEQEYQKTIDEFKAKQQAQVETPADIQAARQAAKKLGILLDEDSSKFLTEEKFEQLYVARREREKAEEEGVKSVLAEADKIAEEIKASGSPIPFKKKAVLAYASAYGISDLRQAYEDMNSEELAPWKDAQIASRKGASLKTLSGGGKKSPEEVRVTNDNVKDLLHETLTKGS